MLQKTKGIVLKTTRFSESSIVAKIYTENLGLQTYLINGVRSAKSKGKAALYQHGNVLEMVVYHKENATMQRISEAKLFLSYHSVHFDVIKGSVLLFCIELLNKALKEHLPHEELFQFCEYAFAFLDETNHSVSNFHLSFMITLSKHLGFAPAAVEKQFFDLQDGVFTDVQPQEHTFLEGKLTSLFVLFLKSHYDSAHTISVSAIERKQLLNAMITYFKLHLEDFGEMHSPQILSEILRS